MSNEKPIICQICGKEFLTEIVALMHLEVKCSPTLPTKDSKVKE